MPSSAVQPHEAHLFTHWDRPDESIDLAHMDRLYEIGVGPPAPQIVEPFSVSGRLSWRWDALDSARTATTEQDLMMHLHGRETAADMTTEPRWLRVDIAFRATLPMGEPQGMPGKAVWKRFVGAVAKKVEPEMPAHEIDFSDGPLASTPGTKHKGSIIDRTATGPCCCLCSRQCCSAPVEGRCAPFDPHARRLPEPTWCHGDLRAPCCTAARRNRSIR